LLKAKNQVFGKFKIVQGSGDKDLDKAKDKDLAIKQWR
jgi:hypothetical protein